MHSTLAQNLWVTRGITLAQLWVVIRDLHTAVIGGLSSLWTQVVEHTVYSPFTHRYVHSLGITFLSVKTYLYTVYTALTMNTTILKRGLL